MTTEQETSKAKNHNKYRRDKPWDTEDIDHWKIESSGRNDKSQEVICSKNRPLRLCFPSTVRRIYGKCGLL
jgi:hypothetical protein